MLMMPTIQGEKYYFSGKYDGGQAQGGYGLTLPPYNALGTAGIFKENTGIKKYMATRQCVLYTGYIGGNSGTYWINRRILRYADVLLMLAEAPMKRVMEQLLQQM